MGRLLKKEEGDYQRCWVRNEVAEEWGLIFNFDFLTGVLGLMFDAGCYDWVTIYDLFL